MSARSRHVVRERQLVAELLAGLLVQDEQLRAIDDHQLRCIVAAKGAVDWLGYDIPDDQLALLAHALMQLSPETHDVGPLDVFAELERLRREASALGGGEVGHAR